MHTNHLHPLRAKQRCTSQGAYVLTANKTTTTRRKVQDVHCKTIKYHIDEITHSG
jgi:hypothetical protein